MSNMGCATRSGLEHSTMGLRNTSVLMSRPPRVLVGSFSNSFPGYFEDGFGVGLESFLCGLGLEMVSVYWYVRTCNIRTYVRRLSPNWCREKLV